MDACFSVDAIVGDLAKIEKPDGSFTDVPLSDLPGGIKEGDLLSFDKSSGYVIEREATKERKAKLLDMQNRLFSNRG